MNSVLKLTHLARSFGKGETKLDILKDINLEIKKGEIVALVGPSGSGKSTLLHLAGLLDTPTKGSIEMLGQNATKMNDAGRTKLRMKTVGFVYQSHLLLPDFNALENVMMPQLIAGVQPKQAKEKAMTLLKQVGLSHRLTHRAGQLSGGEQQRVAIARALANGPALLLADEPTGNLDPKTANDVFETFLSIVRKTGLSALLATHNPELAKKMDRRICIQNGQIQELR